MTIHEKEHSRTADTADKKYRAVLNNLESLLPVSFSSWVKRFQARVSDEGKSFRSELRQHPEDVDTMKIARFIFHAASVVSPILYYAKVGTVVDDPPKFPATISYTIRRGLPKKVHLVLWLSGWAAMFRVLRRRSSPWIQRYCARFFLTGLWTTQIFPLNNTNNALVPEFVNDICHFFGAVVYIFDHVTLMKIVNIPPLFRRIFFSSFGSLAYSLFRVKRIERRTGIVMEKSGTLATPRQRQRILSEMPPPLRRSLFRWELMVMFFENLLFASFVQGMPSGLLLHDDDKKDNDNHDGDTQASKNNDEGNII